MKRNCTITAESSEELFFMLSFFAFSNFLIHGRGLIMAKKKQMETKGVKKADVLYSPASKYEHEWTDEMKQMVAQYNPCKEIVIDMVKRDGSGRCVLMRPKDKNSAPQETYRTGLKESQLLPIVPGTLLRSKKKAGHVQPGEYVFFDQEGNDMRLIEVKGVADRRILTGNKATLHIDFAGMFEELDINMWEAVRVLRGKQEEEYIALSEERSLNNASLAQNEEPILRRHQRLPEIRHPQNPCE